MAGDWIPMRLDLHEDPAVIAMADALGCREETVVGYLHKIWSWMSRQMRDKRATNVTLMSLGRVTNLPGFPELMRDNGWLLEGEEDGTKFIEVPNFERWLGESAKKRLENTKRQNARRANVAQNARQKRDKSATTEEKRREENINERERGVRLFGDVSIPENLREILDDLDQWAEVSWAAGQVNVFTFNGQLAEFSRRGPIESREIIRRSIRDGAQRCPFWEPRQKTRKSATEARYEQNQRNIQAAKERWEKEQAQKANQK